MDKYSGTAHQHAAVLQAMAMATGREVVRDNSHEGRHTASGPSPPRCPGPGAPHQQDVSSLFGTHLICVSPAPSHHQCGAGRGRCVRKGQDNDLL